MFRIVHYYYVAYNYGTDRTNPDSTVPSGWGACEIRRTAPIKTYKDVHDIAETIRKEFDFPENTTVVVTNFTLLRRAAR